MVIKFDGGISSQPDAGLNETLQCLPPPTHVQPQNTCTPFSPDAGVPYTPADLSTSTATEPTIKAAELKSQVELCKRPANIGPLGQLGIMHHWLRTPNKEVGMGETPGKMPGHGEPPPVFRPTQWIDHSLEKEKQCEVVSEVDAACVERETELGKSTGDWQPFINDCHTKTQEVLEKCSTKPKNAAPDFGDPSKTGAGYSL